MKWVSSRTALMLTTMLVVASCGDSTEVGPPTSQSIDVAVTYHGDPPIPLPDIAELGPIGPAEAVDVEWSRVTVPAGPADGFVQYESVFSVAGRFFLIGTHYPSFEERAGAESSEDEVDEQHQAYRAGIRPMLWSSDDGQAWEEVDLGDVPAVEYLQPVMTGDGVLLVGTVWESPEGPYTVYFRSVDGVSWGQGPIEGPTGFGVASAGTVDGRVLLVGSYVGFDGIDDVSVERDGLVFTRSWREERVTVVDAGGVVLFEEDIRWLDQFAAETDEGLRIFDPDTGEVLMVVPGDLSIEDGTLEYESGGYRLEADYREDPGSFRLTDLGGTEVMAGTLEDLWDAGTIEVPDGSDGVLMAVTFAELREAEDRLYEVAFEEMRKVVALIERDDGGWDEMEIDLDGAEPYGGLAHGDAGLVLVSSRWSEEAIVTEFRGSADGRAWDLLASLDRPLYSLSPLDGRYLAVGDAGAGGAALFTSDDGVVWEPMLVVFGPVGGSVSPALTAGAEGAIVVMSEWGAGGGPKILDGGEVDVFVEGDFISVGEESDDMAIVFVEGFVDDLYASGELRDAGDMVEILFNGEVIGAVGAVALEEAMASSYDPEASLRQNIPYTSVYLTLDGHTVTRLAGDDFEALTVNSGAIVGDTVVLLGHHVEGLLDEQGLGEFEQFPVLLVGVVP